MTTLIRTEMRKLTSTRSGVALALAPAVYTVLVVFLVRVHGGADEVTAIDLARGVGDVVPLVWGVLGALAIAGEIRDGSIVATLVAVPDRRRLFAAKAAAVALTAVAATAMALVAGTLAAASLAPSTFLDAASAGELAQTIFGVLAVAAGFAAIGVAIGAVVGQPTAAAVGLVLWLLVGERAVPVALGVNDAARWMPGRAGEALIDAAAPLPESLAAGSAAIVLGVVVATAAAVASEVFRRRDVTS